MPIPNPSIGALAFSSAMRPSSSRPPLARIVTFSPPSSRMRRTLVESAIKSPLSRRTPLTLIPGSLETRRKRHDLSGRGLGVVGIDQEDQAVRPSVRKSLEGIGLVVVGPAG